MSVRSISVREKSRTSVAKRRVASPAIQPEGSMGAVSHRDCGARSKGGEPRKYAFPHRSVKAVAVAKIAGGRPPVLTMKPEFPRGIRWGVQF